MAVILLTGGVRSGKSAMAQRLLEDGGEVLYIATARCLDGEMERRIALHRASRPAGWQTVEASARLDRVLEEHPAGAVLLDCVSNMVTNLMLDAEPDYDTLSQIRVEEIERDIAGEFDRLMDTLDRQARRAVIVTNEVGLGLVSPYRLGRVFADILGRVNQRLAARSDEVYLLSCGLPLRLK